MNLTSYLDIQSIPDLTLHERDRALQRTVVCLIATAVWTFELWTGRFDPLPYRIGLVVSIGCLLATLGYLRFGNWARPAEGAFLTFFLISDPLFFISLLALDPRPSRPCTHFCSSSSCEAGFDTD